MRKSKPCRRQYSISPLRGFEKPGSFSIPAPLRLILTSLEFTTMYKSVMRFTIAIGAIVAAACVYDAPVTPTGDTISAARTSSLAQSNKKPFVINFSGNQVPVDLVAQVAAAGGQVTSSLDRIGVALVSSDDP